MTISLRWLRRFNILASDNKGPWGGGPGDDGKSGGGPRNPWTIPPGTRANRPSALDEFIKRARGGGPGGGSGGGGGMPSFGGHSLWLIGIVLIVVVWLLFTSIHPIGPQQRGVVTFLGRFTGTLEPGIRLTLPAPLEAVDKVDVQAIRTDDFPESEASENLMLTGDQNIIDLAYSVRWDIKDPQDYVFQIADPKSTVRATAESAMRAVIASVTLNEAIGSGRSGIEDRVQQRMQEILDSYNAGVRVQGIAIKKADPPAAVIDDFKAVSAAQQEAQANLNQAHTYAQQLIAHAQGEAAQFDKVYAQYRLAPEVTRRRMYYETMEDVLARTDKTIVEAPGISTYLPLNGQRLPDAVPAAPAQPAEQGAAQ